MKSILFFLLGINLLGTPAISLDVSISDISVAKGNIYLAVFDNVNDFDQQQNPVYTKVIPVSSTKDINLKIPILAAHAHVLAVYHDVNNNGKLDANMLGIPKEPYAFSNNPSSKWQKPTFEETTFIPLQAAEKGLRLKLMTWEQR